VQPVHDIAAPAEVAAAAGARQCPHRWNPPQPVHGIAHAAAEAENCDDEFSDFDGGIPEPDVESSEEEEVEEERHAAELGGDGDEGSTSCQSVASRGAPCGTLSWSALPSVAAAQILTSLVFFGFISANIETCAFASDRI
jgi:hypothetical protein